MPQQILPDYQSVRREVIGYRIADQKNYLHIIWLQAMHQTDSHSIHLLMGGSEFGPPVLIKRHIKAGIIRLLLPHT